MPARAWSRFWFTPAPTSTVAVVRIVVGLLCVAATLQIGSDFDHFFGPDGVVAGREYAAPVAGALLLASTCLTIGLWSRTSAAATLVCLVLLHRINPMIWNAGDALLRHLVFFLMLAPSGAALSVDSTRKGRGGAWEFPERTQWAVRLIQVQVALMYVVSFTQKLRGSTWRDGTAVSYVLRIGPDQRFVVPDFVTMSEAWAHLLTWGTLVIEAAIPLLVWHRRTRPFVLALGVVLHVSIDLTVRTGLFTSIVLASYLAFLPPETASRLLWRLRQRYSTLARGGR